MPQTKEQIKSNFESLCDTLIVTDFDVPIQQPEFVFVGHNLRADISGLDFDAAKQLVQALRYCDHAVICLAEKLLPLSVIEELRWLHQNECDARIVVKTKELSLAYKDLSNHFEINAKIDANFAVAWKKEKVDSFLLSDTIYRINDGEELVKLLDGKKSKIATELTADLFRNAKEIYFCDAMLSLRKEWEISAALAGNAQTFVVGSASEYNGKNTYNYFSDKKFKLLLCENEVRNQIWIDADHLYCVHMVMGGYISVDADWDDARAFLSNYFYTPVYWAENLVKNEPRQSYWLSDGIFAKSHIKEKRTICTTLRANSIEEYLNTEFDRSFMAGYAIYREYCEVRFETTLVPPLLKDTDKPSEKYAQLVDILRKGIVFLTQQLQRVDKDRTEFETFNLSQGYISDWYSALVKLLPLFKVSDGHNIDCGLIASIKELSETSINSSDKIKTAYCALMKQAIGGEYGTKTGRFDSEITGWQKKIDELKSQLSDENLLPDIAYRIEKKIREAEGEISTLNKLKEKLSPQAEESGNADLVEILKRYDSFLLSKSNVNVTMTLDSVLAGDDDKIAKLEKAALSVIQTLLICQSTILQLHKDICLLDLPEIGILYTNENGAVLLAISQYAAVEGAKKQAVKYGAIICTNRIYNDGNRSEAAIRPINSHSASSQREKTGDALVAGDREKLITIRKWFVIGLTEARYMLNAWNGDLNKTLKNLEQSKRKFTKYGLNNQNNKPWG